MKNIWKNSLLILIAIFLIVGSFVFVNYKNNQQKSEYNAQDVSLSKSKNEVLLEGDSSKNWKEILAETNPNDQKSKSSNIKSTTTNDLTKKNNSEKLNPIDIISRDFFARYMELRQIGASNDKLSQQELVNRTAGNIILSTPVKYKIGVVLTKPDSGNVGVKQYANDLNTIFKKYTIKARNEGLIAKEYLEKDDPEILKEIDPTIVSYKNMLNGFLKLKVPSSVATLHLNLINGTNGALFIAQSFRDSGVDAIKGLQAVAAYEIVEKNLYDSITEIKSYLRYLGIYENIF